MSTEKIIFLDFDGVLCTDRSYKGFDPNHKSFEALVALFDPDCVANLNQLEGEIVVSSNWRYDYINPYPCADLLKAAGVTLPVIGETPKLSPYHRDNLRGAEIAAWINQHGLDLSQIIILDDLAHAARGGLPGQGARLIQTPESTGFQKARFLQRAIQLQGGCK